jgi:hypothetical protein
VKSTPPPETKSDRLNANRHCACQPLSRCGTIQKTVCRRVSDHAQVSELAEILLRAVPRISS